MHPPGQALPQYGQWLGSTHPTGMHSCLAHVLYHHNYKMCSLYCDQNNGAFPLPDSDSYSYYCTDSDSMQKCSTGMIPMVIPYANHGHFASLFEELIVVSIDPLLACLVIPTTGLYNNFHSFK